MGPLACSRCRKINYCSVNHQRAHWQDHKKFCTPENSIGCESINVLLPNIRFPEWEIVIEANNPDEENDDESVEQYRWKEYQDLLAAGNTGTLKDVPDNDLDKYITVSEAVDDKFFKNFKNEMKKDQDQILRYKRGGNPLWIANVEQTFGQNPQIPNCELCDNVRQFEFQIMPQMLNLLKDDNIDWGVLAVYTCSKSCNIPDDTGYVTEFIIKQDIIFNENKN